MRMTKIRAALLICVVVLGVPGCGNSDIPAPLDARADVTATDAARVSEYGSITVTNDVRPGRGGALYTEGAVADVILINEGGQHFAPEGEGGRLTFHRLKPGKYTIRPALRPCDGNCGYLDGRVDSCASQIHMGADNVRLHVVYRVGKACHIERL